MNRIAMRRQIRAATRAVLIAALVLSARASAQVPPHQPGTICFTPRFWCWMAYPGIPGQQCWCPAPYGPVPGVIG
jgi:hypothetical protein